MRIFTEQDSSEEFGKIYTTKDGKKGMEIMCGISMRDTKKCFPEVEELTIGKNVEEINIPNSMFPNVRHVISHSKDFRSDTEYLERCWFYTSSYILLNTFCHPKEDIIDLDDVMEISGYAFKDSECTNVMNIKRLSNINAKAFADSSLDKQPYVNGVKMAGPILVDVDKTADVIEIPDDKIMIQRCMVDFTGVKNVITHSTRTFTAGCIKTFPEMVTFDLTDKTQSIYELVISLHRCVGNNDAHIKNIRFTKNTEENYGVKAVDNVVYSKNGEALIACTEEIEHLIIPDGVTEIKKEAFYNCRFLKSVEMPDSITEIGESAFESCISLENVRLSDNIAKIQYKTFARCYSLTYIEITKNVKQIERYAFNDGCLEKVSLNEGLELIDDGAFNLTDIHKIEIPSTVAEIGDWAFGENIEEIRMQSWFPEIIYSVVYSTPEVNSQKMNILKIECNGKSVSLPKRIKKGRINKLCENVDSFMQGKEFCISTFEYASASQCRENMAVDEVLECQNENAKEFVKKNSRRIAFRYTEEKDEEKLAKLLQTGLVSKMTMQKLLDEIGEDMVTARAYIIEAIGKEGSNKFSI